MGKKILMSDDDRTNVLIIQKRLESSQFTVVTASDGDEGLGKVKTEKPDLILLDVEMPRMNGYTFINELRKIEGCKSIPVIVLTAHAEHQPIFGLKGLKGYLVKPIKMDLLLEKVCTSLGLPPVAAPQGNPPPS